MLARRFATAVGIALGLASSQLPEYAQQYRQRLGGAIDELTAIIAQFDAEAARLSLDRAAGIARLRANGDELARLRGADIEEAVERAGRLERQRRDFVTSGPVSQYWVLFGEFDSRVGARAYADYEPAVPATSAGLVAGGSGLLAGWAFTHALAVPLRRRRRPATAPVHRRAEGLS